MDSLHRLNRSNCGKGFLICLWIFASGLVLSFAGFAAAQEPNYPVQQVPSGLIGWPDPTRMEWYTVYAEGMLGGDWGEKINNAIDKLLARWWAGEVVLPPGKLYVTTPITFFGTRTDRQGKHIVLRGSGGPESTELIWVGEPNTPVIEMVSTRWVRLQNLTVRGSAVQGQRTPGVIGVRWRAGW